MAEKKSNKKKEPVKSTVKNPKVTATTQKKKKEKDPSKSGEQTTNSRSAGKNKQDGSPKTRKKKPDKKHEIAKLSNDSKELELMEKPDPDAIARGDEPMTVVGHLNEMRSRLIRSVLSIIIITLASFFFSEYIMDFLTNPYTSSGLKLNVFDITEGFLLRLKASLITGILASIPVIIYEVWQYIKPAINKEDRRFAAGAIMAAVILFFGGIGFTYLYMLPIAIKMLLSFTPADMQNMQNASNYLSFVLLFSLGMGILFELPIIIMVLTRIGIITPQFLIRKRKYAIVLIFVVAAILTPPDVLTQLMLAIPLILLYEISILISKFVVIRKHKRNIKKKN